MLEALGCLPPQALMLPSAVPEGVLGQSAHSPRYCQGSSLPIPAGAEGPFGLLQVLLAEWQKGDLQGGSFASLWRLPQVVLKGVQVYYGGHVPGPGQI